MSTLLLGIGNIIMGDDGIGPHLINRMQSDYTFMPGVRLLDGGTLGLDLLHHLQGVTCLIIVDAYDMGKPPGHLQRFQDNGIPAILSAPLSAHQSGLQDLLALADLQGYLPQRIVLWGVQPETVSLSLEMSPAVAECMDELVLKLLDELEAWGIGYERKIAAHLTQDEVARRMGTTQSVVARLESGHPLPSLRSLKRYAEAVCGRVEIRVV